MGLAHRNQHQLNVMHGLVGQEAEKPQHPQPLAQEREQGVEKSQPPIPLNRDTHHRNSCWREVMGPLVEL